MKIIKPPLRQQERFWNTSEDDPLIAKILYHLQTAFASGHSAGCYFYTHF
nr:MAG TPA: hypothetical protein [Caudoviricetes sp.]